MTACFKKEESVPELQFEVFCAQCGKGLCGLTVVRGDRVEVDPCPRCQESARDKGYDEGYEAGYAEGEDNGQE